jgi:hypothetical protein
MAKLVVYGEEHAHYEAITVTLIYDSLLELQAL